MLYRYLNDPLYFGEVPSRFNATFESLTPKELRPISWAFTLAHLPVKSIESTNKAKRQDGALMKSCSFILEDGRTLGFRVKADDSIFECTLDGNRIPLENTGCWDDTIQELEKDILPYIYESVIPIDKDKEPPKTSEENVKEGKKAMWRVIHLRTDEPQAIYRKDVGWIGLMWGKPGKKPPEFESLEDMKKWWKKLKDKFSLFKGGRGLSHIIAKRDWEGKWIEPLLGQSGTKVTLFLVKALVHGIANPNAQEEGKIEIIYQNTRIILSQRKDAPSKKYWLLTGMEIVDRRKYRLKEV